MTVTELLARFANPEVMTALPASDKLFAGLITTVLGMGITFTALVVLQFIIGWMDKLLNNSGKQQEAEPSPTTTPSAALETQVVQEQDDKELVAVIAATIAMQLKTSVDNIVIRNIEKVSDHSPAWNRAGIIEQMNSRF
ncbi:MAG: OadG family protein [Desulforhopalus sp.]